MNGFARAVRNGDNRAAEFLHFKQSLTFRLVPLLTKKKREAGFRSDDGFGAMAKLKSVVGLAIGAGHFRDFKTCFSGHRVERALSKEYVVREVAARNEGFDPSVETVNLGGELNRNDRSGFKNRAGAGAGGGKVLEGHEHRCERARHHCAFFVCSG